ncbi:MAG: hypothetical protein WAM60_04500 [Candidatus Promineifilaceae bacterium]
MTKNISTLSTKYQSRLTPAQYTDSKSGSQNRVVYPESVICVMLGTVRVHGRSQQNTSIPSFCFMEMTGVF